MKNIFKDLKKKFKAQKKHQFSMEEIKAEIRKDYFDPATKKDHIYWLSARMMKRALETDGADFYDRYAQATMIQVAYESGRSDKVKEFLEQPIKHVTVDYDIDFPNSRR